MKKSIIKKALVAATVLPCMLLTTACGSTLLSTEQKEDKYQKLRQMVISENCIDQNFKAAEFKNISTMKYNYDFSRSGLTETQIEILKNDSKSYQGIYMENDYTNKVGILDNNTGYLATDVSIKDNILGEESTEVHKYNEFVKKDGENYLIYNAGISEDESDEGEEYKEIYKTDSEYVKNLYKDSMEYEILYVCEEYLNINQYKTYSEFVNGIKQHAEDIYKESMYVGETELVYEEQFSKVNLKESGKEYILTVEIEMEGHTLEEEVEVPFSYSNDIKVVFDDDSINKFCYDFEIDVSDETKTSEEIAGVEGLENINLNDNNIIIGKGDLDIKYDFNLNSKFDNSIMSQSVEGYLGQGENNVIESRESWVDVYSFELNEYLSDYEGKFDKDYIGVELAKLSSEIEHVSIEGFYYDKQYKNKVLDTAKFPSYDTTIYAKYQVEEGYSVLKVDVSCEDDWWGEVKSTDYYSFDKKGVYTYNIPEGYKIKNVKLNNENFDGDITVGFVYNLNELNYIEIELEEIVEE